MQSALKFLIAGTALVVIVGLGAIFYSLFDGGQEEKQAATVQPQAGQQKSAGDAASSQCPAPAPASGYVSGKYVFRLSNEVFPPSPSLAKEIHDRYGSNAQLADWGELKSILASEDDVRKFIQDAGIRLQSTITTAITFWSAAQAARLSRACTITSPGTTAKFPGTGRFSTPSARTTSISEGGTTRDKR